MTNLLDNFDTWLDDSGPAALVLRQSLMPVEGHDAVLFPATFAASEDKTFKGGYNIDEFPEGKNVCLIDSVGAQANRIEPLFARKEYAPLIPQVIIQAGDKKVNLLEAGHRAGDAIVRCSALQQELRNAFRAVQKGDAEPLAKIAPTSIVFGAWDSRDTQAKLPRLIASTIRAFDVQELTRSAQYIPATAYVADGLLEEPADKPTKDAYVVRGFVHVPASGSHGGVIATGGVRRNASLHLAALRFLTVHEDEARTRTLRRYIFGLSLIAFTYPVCGYLRQGCNLVLDPETEPEFKMVYSDGRRADVALNHLEALAYAQVAAQAFGINLEREIGTPPDRTVEFDKKLAKTDIENSGKKKPQKDAKTGK
jgi:CRISPR-associated protein Csb1